MPRVNRVTRSLLRTLATTLLVAWQNFCPLLIYLYFPVEVEIPPDHHRDGPLLLKDLLVPVVFIVNLFSSRTIVKYLPLDIKQSTINKN